MSCHPIIKGQQITGWVCSRKRDNSEICHECGKPAVRLCDFEIEDGTCDLPMCRKHSNHITKHTDYCDKHFNILANSQMTL